MSISIYKRGSCFRIEISIHRPRDVGHKGLETQTPHSGAGKAAQAGAEPSPYPVLCSQVSLHASVLEGPLLVPDLYSVGGSNQSAGLTLIVLDTLDKVSLKPLMVTVVVKMGKLRPTEFSNLPKPYL